MCLVHWGAGLLSEANQVSTAEVGALLPYKIFRIISFNVSIFFPPEILSLQSFEKWKICFLPWCNPSCIFVLVKCYVAQKTLHFKPIRTGCVCVCVWPPCHVFAYNRANTRTSVLKKLDFSQLWVWKRAVRVLYYYIYILLLIINKKRELNRVLITRPTLTEQRKGFDQNVRDPL